MPIESPLLRSLILIKSFSATMKAALTLILAVAVMGFPVDDTESVSGGVSDLINSIMKIQEQVKAMRSITLGNHTEGWDNEVKDGVDSLTKNVTYENLIGRVQTASQKIKDVQARLSGIMKNLDKSYPSPPQKAPPKEPEK